MQANLHVRVLPQQHVVLEVDANLPVEGHVQSRHEFAFEAIAHAWRTCFADFGGQYLWCGWHSNSLLMACDAQPTPAGEPPLSGLLTSFIGSGWPEWVAR